MLSSGKFEKRHALLIFVTRLGVSCSLFATFGAQNIEEDKILEEINHEDRNAYVGYYVNSGCRKLRSNCHVLWPRHAARISACFHQVGADRVKSCCFEK
jgi:hypothetical protein